MRSDEIEAPIPEDTGECLDCISLRSEISQAEAKLEAARVGDLNQGIGSNIEVLRVDGDPNGKGLPHRITIKAIDTGEAHCFEIEDRERFEQAEANLAEYGNTIGYCGHHGYQNTGEDEKDCPECRLAKVMPVVEAAEKVVADYEPLHQNKRISSEVELQRAVKKMQALKGEEAKGE